MFTTDRLVRDLQKLLYGNPAAAHMAARDIAADLAFVIEHRQWGTTDCDVRINAIAELLLRLRND